MVAEEGSWIAELFLLKNGEAYLKWELPDGTMYPLSDCYWTLNNDYLLLFNNGGVEVEGSMALENVELRYDGEAILLVRGANADSGPQPESMIGNWSLVSVDAEGWKFNPDREGIYSWLTVHEDLTVDYHWHDSNGNEYDEKNLEIEMLDGALIHEYGNHFWHGKLVGNADANTEYYIALTDVVLLLVEYNYSDGKETPMVNVCEYMPYSP